MQNQSVIEKEFEAAFAFHMQNELDMAEKLYRSILDVAPDEPHTLHFLGILLFQKYKSDEALQLIRRSLVILPSRADWRNDLGNVLVEYGDLRGAKVEFSHALELSPHDAVLWNNLGSVLSLLNEHEDSQKAFRKAISIDQLFSDALLNLANSLDREGRDLEAAEFHCRAYILPPTENKPKSLLGIAYYKLGRYAEAAEVYREWMLEEPDNPVARHLYSACSGEDVPERASNGYVENQFDKFAKTFDSNLQNLSYCGPRMIQEALDEVMHPSVNLDILDAGCGTGLCGPVLSKYSKMLVGVDISSGMLQEATKRGLYHRLIKSELSEFLIQNPESFDLIVAADTLIYFGDLRQLLMAVHRSLKGDGFFVFTIELSDDDGQFHLNPNGRYSHGKNYLQGVLTQTGFVTHEMKYGVVRVEFGIAVPSLTVTTQKIVSHN